MTNSRISRVDLNTENQEHTEDNRIVNIHRYNRTIKKLEIGARKSLKELLDERKAALEKWFSEGGYDLIFNDVNKEYEYVKKEEE